MRKEVREVTDDGLMRVTIADERWYALQALDMMTGLPTWDYVPSVTWITGHYPKGTHFYKWLAERGWDEAQAVKQASADKGTKIHTGAALLMDGQTLGMDSRILNPSSGVEEELTLEEYEALLAFADWWRTARPTLLRKDFVLVNEEHRYAGTADLLVSIGDVFWLLDIKTGQHVWPEHEIQVSAYKHAIPNDSDLFGPGDPPPIRLGILQLGYKRNRQGWKLTEVEDQFPLFLAAQAIWAKETAGQFPLKREYPLTVTLAHGEAPPAKPRARRRRTPKQPTLV